MKNLSQDGKIGSSCRIGSSVTKETKIAFPRRRMEVPHE